MATGYKNNKSTTKGIRFPHELIEKINANVEKENSNFSSWVIDACEKKLTSGKPPEPVSTIVTAPQNRDDSAFPDAFTNRKKLFAKALKKGMTQKAAAIAAGYSEKTAKVKGSQLAKDPHVVAYMASESE